MRISDWSSDVCSSDLLPQQTPFSVEIFAASHQLSLSNGQRLLIASESIFARLASSSKENSKGKASVAPFPRYLKAPEEIGRASSRERVCQSVKITAVAVSVKKKKGKKDTPMNT